jgi:hypothetical protein
MAGKGGSKPESAPHRGRLRSIAIFTVATVVLLIPPLALDAELFATLAGRTDSEVSARVNRLRDALRVEEAGALKVVNTYADDTLSPFERTEAFARAQRSTDAAIVELTDRNELSVQLREMANRLSAVRSAAERAGTVSAAELLSDFARLKRLVPIMQMAAVVHNQPAFVNALAQADTLSSIAHHTSAAGSGIVSAFSSRNKSFASVGHAQRTLTAFAATEWEGEALGALNPPASGLDRISVWRTSSRFSDLSVGMLRSQASSSVAFHSDSSQTFDTRATDLARRAAQAVDDAVATLATSEVHPTLERAQLALTCCVILTALVASVCVAYVFAASIGADGTGADRSGSIDHMIAAHRRVTALMERILRFDCTDASDIASGPALSAVEAELRGLLKPLANVIAHVPRAALIPHELAEGADPLAPLQEEPALRHNVSILFIDVHVLNDVAFNGDSIKSLPQRALRLRAAVTSEVLRRGGVPVMTPLGLWAFAWNLSGTDKAGVPSATQCAINILSSVSVEYPQVRLAVVTGTVGVGTAGSPTLQVHVLAGTPVLLAPVSLRVAKLHNAGIVVDGETYANCSSQSYRSRPIEVVATQADGVPSTVLYDMLSSLDSHDQRLLLWNKAFEKYRTGRVRDALAEFRAWADQETSDRTVQRLIRLLESSPPQLVTCGDSPAAMFTSVADE